MQTEPSSTNRYSGVDFYEMLTRKNGKGTRSIIIVNPAKKNGICPLTLACPKGELAGKTALPVQTWSTPEFLAGWCRKVSETEARQLDPAMMAFVDKHDRSPEFRAMYAIEESKPGRSPLQRATVPMGTPTSADKFHEIYGY